MTQIRNERIETSARGAFEPSSNVIDEIRPAIINCLPSLLLPREGGIAWDDKSTKLLLLSCLARPSLLREKPSRVFHVVECYLQEQSLQGKRERNEINV